MSHVLSTAGIAPRERLPYWTDLVCATYVKLECDAVDIADADGFRGTITSHRLPGLDLSIVDSRAQRVMRTPGTIAKDADDCFIVSLQTRGQGLISQDGRDALLTPGDFAIYDSTRPYTLRFDDDFEEIVLKLRGEQLRAMVRDTEKLTATKVSGREGAGHLMISMVRTLRDEVASLAPASAAAVASGVVNLLAAGLQSLPACGRSDPSVLAAYHRERIRVCLDRHLADPGLTIEQVAAELGMSIGHLHRLFHGEPQSPSQYLWSRRLEACSRALLDARNTSRSVGSIGFDWGFNDAAHFSRAFREKYGVAPRDWRRRGGVG